MEFPTFRYHPDPIATGSVVRSEKKCEVCGAARGFVYTVGTYGLRELDSVCPWCIADGSAHLKFGAEFVDKDSIGDNGRWERVSKDVVEEVAFRTPGFAGWQHERWFTHCGDAAEFLGPMGKPELERMGSEAIEVVRLDSNFQREEWKSYFDSLDAKHGPTAYIFRFFTAASWVGTLTVIDAKSRRILPVPIRSILGAMLHAISVNLRTNASQRSISKG